MERGEGQKKVSENQKLLSPQQKEEIKMAFDFFDLTGAGTIDAKNLKVVLRALGFDPSNDEIAELIRSLGRDIGTGPVKLEEYTIDFQEFLEIMIEKMEEGDFTDDIEKTFDLFLDHELKQKNKADGKGAGEEYITKKSLMAIVQELGEDLTEEEVEELIIGACAREKLIELGRVKNEDTSKTDKNFDDPKNMVSKAKFLSILSFDRNETKFKVSKPKIVKKK